MTSLEIVSGLSHPETHSWWPPSWQAQVTATFDTTQLDAICMEIPASILFQPKLGRGKLIYCALITGILIRCLLRVLVGFGDVLLPPFSCPSPTHSLTYYVSLCLSFKWPLSFSRLFCPSISHPFSVAACHLFRPVRWSAPLWGGISICFLCYILSLEKNNSVQMIIA